MKWILSVFFCFLSISCMAQKKQVIQGNELYQGKKYQEASAAYQEALKKNPSFVPGIFNLGNALYQQKNFDGSRKTLEVAAKQAQEKKVKADAHYNIGNTYMSEQKWEEAVQAYKAALKNNPQDEAAKYNLSYALTMMKKQQGGGGNNKQNNQDKNQDNKDQQDQNQQKDQQKDQNKDEQNPKDQQQQQQDKKEDQQQQERPQPQPSKLSQEQAEQLLNALAQEEKKLHDKKEKGKAVKVKVDKDW